MARGLSGSWRSIDDIAAWRVNPVGNYRFFWLRQCVNSPEYQAEVEAFFREVAAQGVTNVVLSVQQNGGGDSRVMYPILAHLPQRAVKSYAADIQYSSSVLTHLNQTKEQFAEAVQEGQVGKQVVGDLYKTPSVHETLTLRTPIFRGDLFVVTDNYSFSSAVNIATVLSDNAVATVVGESTGGRPSSFGDSLAFSTPEGRVPFRVSYKRFVRPDPSRDPAKALEPDISLPITVKDVQAGRSSITAWLGSLAAN